MAANEETRFSDLVASAISADQEGARTLWVPLGENFDSEGPDAVKEYLEAQRQHLVNHVKRLLKHVNEKIND